MFSFFKYLKIVYKTFYKPRLETLPFHTVTDKVKTEAFHKKHWVFSLPYLTMEFL